MSYRLYSCIMLYQYPHAIPVLYVLKDKFSGTFPPPIFGGLGFNMCISTWCFLCQGNQGISARPPDILPGDPLTHHDTWFTSHGSFDIMSSSQGVAQKKPQNPSETKHHTCLNMFEPIPEIVCTLCSHITWERYFGECSLWNLPPAFLIPGIQSSNIQWRRNPFGSSQPEQDALGPLGPWPRSQGPKRKLLQIFHYPRTRHITDSKHAKDCQKMRMANWIGNRSLTGHWPI